MVYGTNLAHHLFSKIKVDWTQRQSFMNVFFFFFFFFFMAAFSRQHQGWVVAKDTIRSTKPKIVTVWLLRKKCVGSDRSIEWSWDDLFRLTLKWGQIGVVHSNQIAWLSLKKYRLAPRDKIKVCIPSFWKWAPLFIMKQPTCSTSSPSCAPHTSAPGKRQHSLPRVKCCW